LRALNAVATFFLCEFVWLASGPEMIATASSRAAHDFWRLLATLLMARSAVSFKSSLVVGDGVVILEGLEGALKEPWGSIGERYEKCKRTESTTPSKQCGSLDQPAGSALLPLWKVVGVWLQPLWKPEVAVLTDQRNPSGLFNTWLVNLLFFIFVSTNWKSWKKTFLFFLCQITAKVCRKQFYETKMKKKYFFLQSESWASQVGMTWWDSV